MQSTMTERITLINSELSLRLIRKSAFSEVLSKMRSRKENEIEKSLKNTYGICVQIQNFNDSIKIDLFGNIFGP